MADTALGSEDITGATDPEATEGEDAKGAEETVVKTDGEETPSKKGEESDPLKKEGEKSEDEKSEGDKTEYEDFTLPEGIEADEELLSKFTEIAGTAKLTQEQAQSLIDLQHETAKKAAQAQIDQWADIRNGWVDEAKKDEEIGGTDYKAKLGVAGKAINKFGTPALVEALNLHGVGDHPEFIRFMYRVGKTISEDSTPAGSDASGKKSAEETLYPDQGQKKE